MKNMKKPCASALAFALALAMGTNISALQANIGSENGKKDIDVNARYAENVDYPTVYHVDVAWGEMEFTYTVSGEKLWDPEKHDYTITVTDGWTATGNEITVTNHSNTAVKADFTYTARNGHNTVTGSFSQNSLTLPTAEGKAVNDATLAGKTTLTLGGTLADTTTNLTRVGMVTVQISKS